MSMPDAFVVSCEPVLDKCVAWRASFPVTHMDRRSTAALGHQHHCSLICDCCLWPPKKERRVLDGAVDLYKGWSADHSSVRSIERAAARAHGLASVAATQRSSDRQVPIAIEQLLDWIGGPMALHDISRETDHSILACYDSDR